VLPRHKVLPRAWEIARALISKIISKPLLTVHYARHVLTSELKRAMVDKLSWGLALERGWGRSNISSPTPRE